MLNLWNVLDNNIIIVSLLFSWFSNPLFSFCLRGIIIINLLSLLFLFFFSFSFFGPVRFSFLFYWRRIFIFQLLRLDNICWLNLNNSEWLLCLKVKDISSNGRTYPKCSLDGKNINYDFIFWLYRITVFFRRTRTSWGAHFRATDTFFLVSLK